MPIVGGIAAIILAVVAILVWSDLDQADKMASVIAGAAAIVALTLQIMAMRRPDTPAAEAATPRTDHVSVNVQVNQRFTLGGASMTLAVCAFGVLGVVAVRELPAFTAAPAETSPPLPANGTTITHPREGALLPTCGLAAGTAQPLPREAIWLITRNPDGTPYFARAIYTSGSWESSIQLGSETPQGAGRRFTVELYAVPEATDLPADPSQSVELPARARKLADVGVVKDPDRLKCPV
ncbi:hypothetical protein HerbRD11066_39300 [Herbidospora sp. RD11066]